MWRCKERGIIVEGGGVRDHCGGVRDHVEV